jgi:hypothetical protein
MACTIQDLLTEPEDWERELAASDVDYFIGDLQEHARCKVAGTRLRNRLRFLARDVQYGVPHWPGPLGWLERPFDPALLDKLSAGPQPEPPTKAARELTADAYRTMTKLLREVADSIEKEADALV